MGHIITLIDGENKTINSHNDFLELVDTYMGFEAMKYFRSFLKEFEILEKQDYEVERLEKEVTKLKNEISELQEKIEELEEEL